MAALGGDVHLPSRKSHFAVKGSRDSSFRHPRHTYIGHLRHGVIDDRWHGRPDSGNVALWESWFDISSAYAPYIPHPSCPLYPSSLSYVTLPRVHAKFLSLQGGNACGIKHLGGPSFNGQILSPRFYPISLLLERFACCSPPCVTLPWPARLYTYTLPSSPRVILHICLSVQ